MRVTFSLALSSLEFDPQTQLSSAPDLIKLFCTDSHQADKYSESPVTSTLLNLVLRPQPWSYWTMHSIWQTLSLLWKLWRHLASRHCRLLGFLLPPSYLPGHSAFVSFAWSSSCIWPLIIVLWSSTLGLFFLYFPSAVSYGLFKKKILSYNIIRYIMFM